MDSCVVIDVGQYMNFSDHQGDVSEGARQRLSYELGRRQIVIAGTSARDALQRNQCEVRIQTLQTALNNISTDNWDQYAQIVTDAARGVGRTRATFTTTGFTSYFAAFAARDSRTSGDTRIPFALYAPSSYCAA